MKTDTQRILKYNNQNKDASLNRKVYTINCGVQDEFVSLQNFFHN